MSWSTLFGRVLTLVLVGQLGLVLWNLRVVTRPRRRLRPSATRVSLLIPARNEEAVIAECLRSVLQQSHANLEIVVLDDRSTDATPAIVEGMAGDRIRLVRGQPLPAGWTGKNWACHQLVQHATGDVFCFVDADTVLEPLAIAAAVDTIEEHDVGLVAMLLRSDGRGLAEAALLPMVNHAVLALFPASLIQRSPSPDLALAFGPCITVTRAAYEAAGGHAADPGHIVDDMQLARSVKAAGYHQRLVNGTDLVTTRWYRGIGEIWRGFSKNAYGGIGYRPWLALAAIFVLAPMLVLPFVRFGVGLASGGVPTEVALQVGLLLTSRLFTSAVGRDPLWTTVLHPFTVTFWAATLGWSMLLGVTGRQVEWKDRSYRVMPGSNGDDTP